MRRWSEARALAIGFANTRCKKRPNDLVTVASAFRYLVNLYTSQKALADKLGVSVEMIRQFLTVLKFPENVQELFEIRQIDSVDIAKELASLGDSGQQRIAAEAIVNLASKDVRDIKRLVRSGGFAVEKAKKAVLRAKPEGLNIFVLDFDDDTLGNLLREAKGRKKKPADLVREIVSQWLEKVKGERS
jgi:transcriptional regulator with XRE-family HTH domain